MSQTESKEFKRPDNVVRLKIAGAKNAVNTLRDQETGRGVSLVCPFPALEVDIPVKFGEGNSLTNGTIHRIGVEDDPRTGLPRLRLAIRASDGRNTVETETGQTLLDASKEADEARGEVEDVTDINDVKGPMVKPLVSWADALGEENVLKSAVEDGGLRDDFDSHDEEEPGWVACQEMPLPEEFLARSTTRRRYRFAKHMAIAFVLGMLVAAGYLLDSAGMVNFSSVTQRIVQYYDGTSETASEKAAPVLEEETVSKATVAEAAVAEAPEKTVADAPAVAEGDAVTASVENTSYSPGVNPLLDETAETAIRASAPEASQKDADSQAAAAEPEATPDNGEEAVASTDITLNLPTRWPVEYATAYRVRDPNGVVVDVPGGLVRREGWLEEGREDPLVRSVKAIQRESGARFIVYVNGDLPRFMTSPKGNGVALRLYYNKDVEDTTTVAALR